jgi:Ser/Thr protein kinase RdoA (MazF antagonist)
MDASARLAAPILKDVDHQLKILILRVLHIAYSIRLLAETFVVVYTAFDMDEGIVTKVALAYELDVKHIHKPQKGYRNTAWHLTLQNGSECNLLFHKREPGMQQLIRRANAAGEQLRKAGLPARYPIDSRILKAQSGELEQLIALYNYLPGETIPWEAYTMDHLKELGKMMSDMHAAWAGRGGEYPEISEQLEQLVDRMEEYFSRSGVKTAMKSKLHLGVKSEVFTTFHEIVILSRELPNQQLLHMDFVRGNVLFREVGGKPCITGIIDFEKTAYGHPLFDVARTLAFLLVDCKYKDEQKIRKYFLKSGYNKRGGQKLQLLTMKHQGRQIDLLEALLDLFLVHDLFKFMLHNPYEFLSQNEHYQRTCNLLVQRQIITPVV